MKITLLSEHRIRLEGTTGALTIESADPEQSYSPFHMLGSSLALCTFSVLYSWAETAKITADDLAIEVEWTFVDDPHRVGEMKMQCAWPSLPEKRLEAAKRAAALCAVHATLEHPPHIQIGVTR